MIYVSLSDNEELKKVRMILLSLTKNEKVVYAEEIKNKSTRFKLSQKAKIIICDEQSEITENFNYKHQIVILYKRINEEIGKKIYFTKNLYIYKKINDLEEILAYEINRLDFKKKIFKFAIIALILIIGIFIFHSFNNKNLSKSVENKKELKEIENKEFDEKKENIVFLGDSITDFYDLDKYFYDYNVVNSGISGNNTLDILNNMEERVYRYNPTKVVLLIGTNDLLRDTSNEEIAKNIDKIITQIKKNRPLAKIYLESIYPVNDTNNSKIDHSMVHNRKNEDIKAINKMIKKIAKDEKIIYIDMYSLLEDSDENMKIEYTKEGLHMSGEGYKVITKTLKKYLSK